MSFILDALRKSESERRREAVPDVTRIPLAPARLELPRWVTAVIGALGLAVVALALAWWHSARAPRPEAAATPAPAPAATPASTAGPARTAAPRTTPLPEPGAEPRRSREIVPLPELAERSTRATADAREPAPAPAPSESGADASRSRAAAERASAAPSDDGRATPDAEPAAALPRISDLRAEGVAIPELRLELHAYGDTPANRFVFVNGQRYGEGDTLDDGQQVVRITPEGAVLEHAGRRFLLLPD